MTKLLTCSPMALVCPASRRPKKNRKFRSKTSSKKKPTGPNMIAKHAKQTMLNGEPVDTYSAEEFVECIDELVHDSFNDTVHDKRAKRLIPDTKARRLLLAKLRERIHAKMTFKVQDKPRRIVCCNMAGTTGSSKKDFAKPVVETVTPETNEQGEEDDLADMINTGFAQPPTHPRNLQTPVEMDDNLVPPIKASPDRSFAEDVSAIKRAQEEQHRQMQEQCSQLEDALQHLRSITPPSKSTGKPTGKQSASTRLSRPHELDFEQGDDDDASSAESSSDSESSS